MHECSAISHTVSSTSTPAQERTPESTFCASSRLHTPAGGEAGYAIGRRCIGKPASQRVLSVRIFAREVQKIDTGEDDEKATKQRNGVDGRRGVEALEKETRRYEGASGESDVIQGVYTRES